MGCWNGADMVTLTPIEYKDPIRMIILRPYCQVNYIPVGPPLKGRYNDYGCIQDVEEGIPSEWLRECLKVTDEMKKNLGRHHYLDDMSDSELIVFAAERGLMTAKCQTIKGDHATRHFATWMVHEETWQAMQKLKYAYYSVPIEEEARGAKELFMERNTVSEDERTFWHMDMSMKFRRIAENYPELFSWAMKNHTRFDEIVDTWTEVEKVKLGLEATNREWQPTAGVGRQDLNTRAHLAIAELAVRQVNRLIDKECK